VGLTGKPAKAFPNLILSSLWLGTRTKGRAAAALLGPQRSTGTRADLPGNRSAARGAGDTGLSISLILAVALRQYEAHLLYNQKLPRQTVNPDPSYPFRWSQLKNGTPRVPLPCDISVELEGSPKTSPVGPRLRLPPESEDVTI